MKVETFLGRWKLETGGIFFGWYGIFKHLLTISSSGLFAWNIHNGALCEVVPMQYIESSGCKAQSRVLIHVAVAVLAVIFIIFEIMLLKGIPKRSYKMVKFSILASVFNLASFIMNIFFSIQAINHVMMVTYTVAGIIETYSLTIKRSLHDKFKGQTPNAVTSTQA